MNREKLLKRLGRLPAKGGHARVLRRKLGLDKPAPAPAPVEKETKKATPKRGRAKKK